MLNWNVNRWFFKVVTKIGCNSIPVKVLHHFQRDETTIWNRSVKRKTSKSWRKSFFFSFTEIAYPEDRIEIPVEPPVPAVIPFEAEIPIPQIDRTRKPILQTPTENVDESPIESIETPSIPDRSIKPLPIESIEMPTIPDRSMKPSTSNIERIETPDRSTKPTTTTIDPNQENKTISPTSRLPNRDVLEIYRPFSNGSQPVSSTIEKQFDRVTGR